MLGKIKFLSLVFFLCLFALVVRLGYWQVVKGKELSEQAKSQYKSSKVLTAPRGNILASDGSFWAVRSESWQPFANPQEIEEAPNEIANKIAPFFVENTDDKQSLLNEIDRLAELLGKEDSLWVPLGREIDNDTKRNIESLKIHGIGFDPGESRFYPEASTAAQLLGFVGKDEEGANMGYFGIEGYYNLALSGKSGFIGGEVDAIGAPILLGKGREVTSISGTDLVTSVDKRIQLTISQKLKEGIEKYGAKAGTVIVMNPTNGQIMAMESYPSYDPKKYWDYGDTYFKNPAISDSFEPGSVFKVLVMAAGLDAGVVEPDTTCDICSAPLRIDKYLIETWNREYHADATMVDVIVHSDNVGMTFVGQKLGADKLYEYLDKFGIGSTTGIDLQGEASPQLRKKGTWSVVDLATATFGQGIATTPIQMIRAVGAIANKGVLVTPKVVEKIKGDGWENTNKANSEKRVISPEASAKITAMMAEAARHGESQWTNLKGFKVAGKTGTAQIPIAGHYDAEKTNASFVGFAPYDKPKFVMLVILNEPQTSQWASETAAPLWYSIAKDIFPYLGIQPE
ncbi:MAG: peptidoglycan D,D-transpeptidase FtsI family protein [Microgenomates group bacterium]